MVEFARNRITAVLHLPSRRILAPVITVAVLLAWTAGCVSPAGRTFVVNHEDWVTNGDSDSNPGDGKCRTAMNGADCSLRAAIQEANALPGADRIEFNLPGGGGQFDLDDPLPEITENLTIDATTQPGYAGEPVASIYSTPSFCFVQPCYAIKNAIGVETALIGLKIFSFSGDYFAIVNHGKLTLEHMNMTENDHQLYSEGIAGTAQVTIRDSIFGVSGDQILTENTDLTVERTIIDHAMNGWGIWMKNGSLLLADSTVRNNVAWLPATTPQGGGIWLEDSEGAFIRNSAILGNQSIGPGGGLYFKGQANAVLQITASTLSGNLAEDGGGIYIESGTAHISGSTLTSNQAKNNGGGIYLAGRETELYVEKGTIIGGQNAGNTADSDLNGQGLGGGIYSMKTLAVSDSTVAENAGDGIYNAGGTVRMQGSNVLHNSKSGIASDGLSGVSAVDIDRSTISFNSLSGIRTVRTGLTVTGGTLEGNGESGIRIETGSLAVTGSTIADNLSSSFGGGIYLKDFVTAVVQSTTVSGNQASASGGGIYIKDSAVGTSLQLLNTTVSGNRAAVAGGGIEAAGGAVLINNVTLADNGAGSIGGMHSAGNVTVANSILAGNAGGNCGGPITSGGHNLDTGATCPFTAPGDLVNLPAGLGPLADNGGGTFTRALLPGSAALEAGDDAICLPSDQRGVTRPQGSHCDIGAFEAEEPATATPQPTPTILLPDAPPAEETPPQPSPSQTRESPPEPTPSQTRESPPTDTPRPKPTREPPQPTPTPTRRK